MNIAVSAVDLTIVVVYMLAVVAFGIWVGRGRQDLSDYLLGGRNLPWWAILGSIVATETSTATFLSVPGIAFAEGGDLRFLQIAMGFLLGRIAVSFLLLPQYFRGNLYTAYEVLDRRFGGRARQTASALFVVARNLGDGLRLFLTAIVLEKVAGFDLPVCILLIGIATVVYTFLGGMKAVVWNDCIQFVVYIAGGVSACLLIIDALPGGWHELHTFATAGRKFRVLDFRFVLTDAYTFWAGLLGGSVLTLGTHGTDQMMVQRYLCTRSLREARRALILSGCTVLVQFALFLLLGVALACFYAHVSPETTFERNDEVFAVFIVNEMPPGIVGLTLAAVFSAAMSTLSSSLNSSATAVVNDLHPFRRNGERSSRQLLRDTRLWTVVFGMVQVIVGIAASHLSRSVVGDALAIAGFTAGILLGLFFLGILTRRATESGALAGMLCGLGVLTAVKFHTAIAWPWFAITGAVTTFLTGLAFSLVLPPGRAAVHNK